MPYHLIGKHIKRESTGNIHYIVDLLRNQNLVLEIWYGNGEYSCMVTKANERHGVVGHGSNLMSAIKEAVKMSET